MPRAKKKKLFTATYTYEGKRYYVRSAVSQRDADKRAAKAELARKEGTIVIGGDMRVADYALRWAETYKSTTTSGPVYNAYTGRINNHIIPAIGAMRMKDVRPTNLQELMNTQAGKSKDHCDKLLMTLRAIFKQAVKDDIIRKNPVEDVRPPKGTAGTHRSLTPEERAALLEVAERHRFGLAIKLMLYCGLRPQEMVSLRWSDIDQINHRLMIRQALKTDGTTGETKSKSGKRDIPIPPALWEALHIPDDLDGYIITNTHGEPCSRTSIRRAWALFKRDMDIALGAELAVDSAGNALTRYGVPVILRSVIAPDLDMYCLRHTYCTDLEAAGVPINVAKYLMGHSSITLTARVYTHMREDTLADAAAKIASIGATQGATAKGQERGNKGNNIGAADGSRIAE